MLTRYKKTVILQRVSSFLSLRNINLTLRHILIVGSFIITSLSAYEVSMQMGRVAFLSTRLDIAAEFEALGLCEESNINRVLRRHYSKSFIGRKIKEYRVRRKMKRREKRDTDILVATKQGKIDEDARMIKRRFKEVEELVEQVNSVARRERANSERLLEAKVTACQAAMEEKMESVHSLLSTIQLTLQQTNEPVHQSEGSGSVRSVQAPVVKAIHQTDAIRRSSATASPSFGAIQSTSGTKSSAMKRVGFAGSRVGDADAPKQSDTVEGAGGRSKSLQSQPAVTSSASSRPPKPPTLPQVGATSGNSTTGARTTTTSDNNTSRAMESPELATEAPVNDTFQREGETGRPPRRSIPTDATTAEEVFNAIAEEHWDDL